MVPLTFWNPLYPVGDSLAYYSFRVDETVYADPWNPGHIPDYSHLEPIEKLQSAWDKHSAQRVVWVHEDAAAAEMLEHSIKVHRKTKAIDEHSEHAQSARPHHNDDKCTGRRTKATIMIRDFLMGYAPAAGPMYAAHPWFDTPFYPLGMPRRVRDALDAGNKAWEAQKRVPVLVIAHEAQTHRDKVGTFIRRGKVLAQMREQAAAQGLTVHVTETHRDNTGKQTRTTRTL